ncbi:MAG: hypothetical protein ABSB41_12885, partial [Anaerolineales bacterium]
FRLPLDIRQAQDNNRHGELLEEATSTITILQEARLFFNKTYRTCYRFSFASRPSAFISFFVGEQ